MATIKFFDRENELSALEKVGESGLVLIYGRRRVGKTRLALRYAEKRDHIYFFVNPKKDGKLLLSEFSEDLRKKLSLPEYVRINSWSEFLSLLSKYKGIVIFDEFQWFLESDKSFPFELQKFWDTAKDKPGIIITGSIYGLLKKMFIDESAPLFKRCDLQIDLQPFDYFVVWDILDDLGVEDDTEKMRFFLTFGGVPYYYGIMCRYGIKSYDEALKTLVFNEYGILKNEVDDILYESFGRDYKVYSSILYAIASGKTQLSEISSILSVKQTSIPAYMDVLENFLRLTERESLLGKKKKSLYVLKDYFANFWFRYVYENKAGVDINPDEVYKRVSGGFDAFFGLMFEKFCRENLRHLNLPFTPSEVRRSLEYVREDGERTQKEIDIVAVSAGNKRALYIECKWKDLKEKEALGILGDLAKKAEFSSYPSKEKQFGLIARKIDGKKSLRDKGFFAYDLEDFLQDRREKKRRTRQA
jgi:AAA+ ATPase superfamily predicted ATPase